MAVFKLPNMLPGHFILNQVDVVRRGLEFLCNKAHGFILEHLLDFDDLGFRQAFVQAFFSFHSIPITQGFG